MSLARSTLRRMPVGPRTSTDYVVAALGVLADHGADGLTVAALCGALGTTKGSFYHHFDGMPAFTTALLAYWETEHSERLIATSRATADPVDRVGVLTDIALDLPHAAESAIRAWSRSSAEVALVQGRVDAHREAHLTDAFEELGLSPTYARLQARMAMALLIGAQHRGPVDRAELRTMLERLDAVFVPDLDAVTRRRLSELLEGRGQGRK